MAIRVNGEEIPAAAIEYELNRLIRFYSEHLSPRQVQEDMEALRRKAVEQAIGTKLLIEEAKRLDIRVPREDVDSRVGMMIQNAGGREQFEQLLRNQGLTVEALRRSIEGGRRVDLLIERITAGVPEPTEEEIRAYFEAHRGEYVTPERAQFQHILIKPASSSVEDRTRAREKLLQIRRRVLEGADFAAEAAAHSDCPSGRRTGGSLGWITRGTMLAEFENAIFSLPIGAVSDVLETPLGFHIVKKNGYEPPREATYEMVRDRICDFLRHVARGDAISRHVAELRKQAVIEET
ncbi:MAG: peptidylprolyl isomerase [Kiritimatiellae bacterium]|nr:peptidylprolyl isomerase [Kiritimatiellia bacterium]